MCELAPGQYLAGRKNGRGRKQVWPTCTGLHLAVLRPSSPSNGLQLRPGCDVMCIEGGKGVLSFEASFEPFAGPRCEAGTPGRTAPTSRGILWTMLPGSEWSVPGRQGDRRLLMLCSLGGRAVLTKSR